MYPAEFKQKAISMVLNEGKAQKTVAQELNISPATLSVWMREVRGPQFTRRKPGPKPKNAARSSSTSREAALQREVEQLRKEVEIMQKAFDYLSGVLPPK